MLTSGPGSEPDDGEELGKYIKNSATQYTL